MSNPQKERPSTAALLRSIYAFAYPQGEAGRASGLEVVRSLIDEGEYGLALEDMCAVLLATHQLAPLARRDEIRCVAQRIGLMESGFIRAVLTGRTEMPPANELPPI